MAVPMVSTRVVSLGRDCWGLEGEKFIVLRVKSCLFSPTCSYDKEWATNRLGGRVRIVEHCCIADVLGRVMVVGRFGLGSRLLRCWGLDVVGS